MVFDMKYDNEGKLVRKCRYVIRGFRQREGIDYDKVYAPTLNKMSIKILLQISVIKGWKRKLADVGGAFVEAEVERKLYATVTDVLGNVIPTRLLKALYGLKQAALLWNEKLDNIMTAIGLTKLVSDPCIYIERDVDHNIIMMVSVHVDDMLVISKTDHIGNRFMAIFARCVTKLKHIRDFNKYLGIEINHNLSNANEIILHQYGYLDELLLRYNTTRRKTHTPMQSNMVIDYNVPEVTALETPALIHTLQELSGTCLFLAACTRPDILSTVGMLSQYTTKPSRMHMHIFYFVLFLSTPILISIYLIS